MNELPPAGEPDLLQHELTALEREAADHFLARATIPFVGEVGSVVEVIGTGLIFAHNGRLVVVTANHIFDGAPDDGYGVPVREADGRRTFWNLGGCLRTTFGPNSYDLCVLDVPHGALRENLLRTYSPVGPDSLASPTDTFEQFVIAGFPKEVAVGGDGHLWPRAIKITTTAYRGVEPENFDAKSEFLLEFAREGYERSGGLQPSPSLKGISGAAVWGVASGPLEGELWSTPSVLRLLGVEFAYLRSSYIRCHRWWPVTMLLSAIDPDLGAACERALGGIADADATSQ